jgi:rubrerythrin
MKQHAEIGNNLTGAMTAPERIEQMRAATEERSPSATGSPHDVAATRIAYAELGFPLGSVPPLARDVEDAAEVLFIDKLGERLAFERSGTRLYEAVISKYDAYGSFDGGPTREELVHILEEEYAHFRMLCEVVEELGGDPTAVTPSADVTGVIGSGLCKVVTDPRTTLLQSLEAILAAELVDNDGWEALVEMAEMAGDEEMTRLFERALAEEEVHLASVRGWLAAGQGRAAVAQEAPH